MKKNRMMRLASVLLVAVLMSTCTISGTFAKYVTSVESEDSARVARWGFTQASMNITNLFEKAYKELPVAGEPDATVLSAVDVIAPGTNNSASFTFKYDGGSASGTPVAAPEVDYTFTVDTTGSNCHDDIKNNANILWSLDGTEFVTDSTGTSWDKMIAAIKALSGDASGSKYYNAGNLPTAFPEEDTVHTVAWRWVFHTDTTADEKDTTMGNADKLAEVTLKITITATQEN